MGVLPWENWIYHVSEKRDKVNELHTSAVSLKDQISVSVEVFNKLFNDYKALVATNCALVLTLNDITNDDLQEREFRVNVNEIENPPIGFLPVTIAQAITEFAGGILALKALSNIGSLAKKGIVRTSSKLFRAIVPRAGKAIEQVAMRIGISGGSEALAVGSAEALAVGSAEALAVGSAEALAVGSAEALAVGGSEAAGGIFAAESFGAIAGLGVGVFAVVGLDAIFGAINGNKESSELQQQIDNLDDAIKKCNAYLKEINNRQKELEGQLPDEINRFQDLIQEVSMVTHIPPNFKFQYESNKENLHSLMGSLQPALMQYGFVTRMKRSWMDVIERKPEMPMDSFIESYAMIDQFDEPTLFHLYQILAQSSKSMQEGFERTISRIDTGVILHPNWMM